MTIRFAKATDADQIVTLCQEHAAFEKASFDEKNKEALLLHHLFQPETTIKCLVVEQDSDLLGYATFMKQFSTWDAGFYIYLDCLFLKERARGKGLGNKMMHEIKTYAKTQNCSIIQWQTPNFNKDAIAFYKRIGAKSKTKERFFW